MSNPKVSDRRVRNNLVEIWNGFEWVVQQPTGAEIMTDHPLTDEMIEKMLEEDFSENYDRLYVKWITGGMRAAYDLGRQHEAEWQENQNDLDTNACL